MIDTILALGPCSDAREWIEVLPPEQPPEESYAACDRGDWLLWLAARAGVDRRLVVLAACDVARTALVHVPAGEERPRHAIETAERWARGEASLEEVRHAARAAARAVRAAAASAARAASEAANAAANAAAAAANDADDDAALVVALVATAAADAAAAAAAAETWAAALAESARLVRARISASMIAAALDRHGTPERRPRACG